MQRHDPKTTRVSSRKQGGEAANSLLLLFSATQKSAELPTTPATGQKRPHTQDEESSSSNKKQRTASPTPSKQSSQMNNVALSNAGPQLSTPPAQTISQLASSEKKSLLPNLENLEILKIYFDTLMKNKAFLHQMHQIASAKLFAADYYNTRSQLFHTLYSSISSHRNLTQSDVSSLTIQFDALMNRPWLLQKMYENAATTDDAQLYNNYLLSGQLHISTGNPSAALLQQAAPAEQTAQPMRLSR